MTKHQTNEHLQPNATKLIKRRAISAVVTTLIILVASVVLGTGVVVFGSSLFATGSQQEGITAEGITVWVNATDSNGIAWGAAAVRNSGDKFMSVDTIQVRGATVPYSNWYVDTDLNRVTSANFQSMFNNTSVTSAGMMKDSNDSGAGTSQQCAADTSNDAGTLEIDLDATGANPTLCLTQASGPTSLNPGERMIVYFKIPNGVVTSLDTGSATNVHINAGKTGSPTSVTIVN